MFDPFVLAVIIAIAFLILERRFKKKFALPELTGIRDGQEDTRPPVAGPLDAKDRRARLEELLQKAGLPSISAIEPHFTNQTLDDLL